jgi:endonuclease YncB( thermonuclease family)
MLNPARLCALCFGLAWRSNSGMAAELAGTAHVVDGDTINLAGAKIRLWGIDALERDQTC